MTLCACGCGQPVTKPTNRFLNYHQFRMSEVRAHIALAASRYWKGRSRAAQVTSVTRERSRRTAHRQMKNPKFLAMLRDNMARGRATARTIKVGSRELALRNYLTAKGFEFACNKPYTPFRHQWDIVLPNYNAVIDLDGCWYHRCSVHNPDSILNIKEDGRRAAQIRALKRHGVKALILWDHEIKGKAAYSRLDKFLARLPYFPAPKAL